jgi:DNA-binding NtrC family response regulator
MSDSEADKRLILVVEDDELIASTMEIALESRGYALAGPVATLEAAKQLLETTKPDLALIDYRLKKGTSEGLLSSLHQRKMPTCVLTGVAADSLPAAYAHCMVLQKPFRLNELIDVVTKLESSIATNPS